MDVSNSREMSLVLDAIGIVGKACKPALRAALALLMGHSNIADASTERIRDRALEMFGSRYATLAGIQVAISYAPNCN